MIATHIADLGRWGLLNDPSTTVSLSILGVLGVLVTGYLVVCYRLRGQNEQGTTAVAIKAPPSYYRPRNGSRTDDWVVVCQYCGARNALGYRYCYNCTGEIPTTVRKAVVVEPNAG